MKKHVIGVVVSFVLFFGSAFAAAGDLQVGVQPYDGYIPKNAVAIPFLTLILSADEEEVVVSSVIVRRQGLSSYTDFERVWAMVDGKRSYNTRVLYDNLARVRFRKPLVIGQGETKEVIIYANMNSLGRGRTVSFSVEDIDSTAQNLRVFSSRVDEKKAVETYLHTPPKKYRMKCVDWKCRKVRE